MPRLSGWLVAAALITAVPGTLRAQTPPDQDSGAQGGRSLPDSEKLKIQADLLLGWGYDGANEKHGFENQGRVGYATITLLGRVHPRVSYRVSLNPVNEVEPVPGCGLPDYFFPNQATFLYSGSPNIPCDPKDGNRRVDGYRGLALDAVRQQGAVREGYVTVDLVRTLTLRIGRMRLPLGFDWEDAGSMSAKDAPRIQRINAEASFGTMFTVRWGRERRERPLLSASVAAVLGEGNRWWDYDYFFFENGSLDSNSALTTVGQVTVSPIGALQVRLSGKSGFTGSKLETYPSYWASKRNDKAIVAGAEWAPSPYARVLGEWARYTWGPTVSSAAMVGVPWSAITKQGYWFSAQGHRALTPAVTLGGSVTREEVDRADSLVSWLSAQGLYGVTEGRKDRMTAVRVFVDLWTHTRVGIYKTFDSNPFPQASGIWPLDGNQRDSLSNTGKYGLVVRLSID